MLIHVPCRKFWSRLYASYNAWIGLRVVVPEYRDCRMRLSSAIRSCCWRMVFQSWDASMRSTTVGEHWPLTIANTCWVTSSRTASRRSGGYRASITIFLACRHRRQGKRDHPVAGSRGHPDPWPL